MIQIDRCTVEMGDYRWYVLKLIGSKYFVIASNPVFQGYYSLRPASFQESKLKEFLDVRFHKQLELSGVQTKYVSNISVLTKGQYDMYIKNQLPAAKSDFILQTLGDTDDTVLSVSTNGEIVPVGITEKIGIRPVMFVEKSYLESLGQFDTVDELYEEELKNPVVVIPTSIPEEPPVEEMTEIGEISGTNVTDAVESQSDENDADQLTGLDIPVIVTPVADTETENTETDNTAADASVNEQTNIEQPDEIQKDEFDERGAEPKKSDDSDKIDVVVVDVHQGTSDTSEVEQRDDVETENTEPDDREEDNKQPDAVVVDAPEIKEDKHDNSSEKQEEANNHSTDDSDKTEIVGPADNYVDETPGGEEKSSSDGESRNESSDGDEQEESALVPVDNSIIEAPSSDYDMPENEYTFNPDEPEDETPSQYEIEAALPEKTAYIYSDSYSQYALLYNEQNVIKLQNTLSKMGIAIRLYVASYSGDAPSPMDSNRVTDHIKALQNRWRY
ncbi:MAG: hypothetical protein II399_09980 [Lachnospiraceae bacterium]|nr:hypothetical protein [Lachnospiraceae bacterium]